MATTDFSNKVQILASFYMNYRDEKNVSDFIEFNDLGLPLAFLSAEGLAEITEQGIQYIEETWNLLMDMFEIEDTGFESLDQLLDSKTKE